MPHISTFRCYPYEDFKGLYGFKGTILAYIYINFIQRFIKYPVSCSFTLNNLYHINENIKTFTIQNSVDVDQYSLVTLSDRNTYKEKIGFNQQKIFITTGGVLKRKDPNTLIEAFIKAFDKNENNVLLILGLGNMNEYKKIYGEYKNIYFIGRVTNITDYLHSADYFISSSISEGLPNAVLEALSCGLYTILSDIPQHTEIVDASLATFFKTKSVESLTQKLLRLPEEYSKEKIRNYIIENFSSKSMSMKYQDYYQKVVNEYFKGSR